MELGIWCLMELVMLEALYKKLANEQLSTDQDEVMCTWPMWWKFVQSAPSAYANSLAEMTWKGQEKSRVDESAIQFWQYEERLSSSLWACISAVHQLSQEAQQIQENESFSLLVKTNTYQL